jgi:hypothetical protein
MKTINGMFPAHSFVYDGIKVNVYHANSEEGLPRHNHEYTHATVCHAGKLKVTKDNIKLVMTKETQPVLLKAGEWHELEAIEDGTVWANIFAEEFMECDTLEQKQITQNKYLIRFNKSRGQEGRGSIDHVWRVFENGNEFLCKHVDIKVPSHSERTGEDWNIFCKGFMSIDHDTSTIIINKVP